ncbi:MAG: ferrous iron transport protein A [Clostridia bacterium]|nr:ferrous iron transport protein A [Clostridia bacterium]
MTLYELDINKKAQVRKIADDCALKDRLSELGLTRGTVVECAMKSPVGALRAYRFRSSVTAIRASVAEQIEIDII